MNMHTTPTDSGHHAAALQAALRSLPAQAPQQDAWPAIRARVLSTRARRRAMRTWLPVAAAASLLLALAVGWSTLTESPQTRAMQAQASRPKPQATAAHAASPTLAELQAHSMQLENWLAQLRANGAPLQGPALTQAVDLQDHIGLIDLQLEAPGDASTRIALWQHRVHLLQNLAMLRLSQSGFSTQQIMADSHGSYEYR